MRLVLWLCSLRISGEDKQGRRWTLSRHANARSMVPDNPQSRLILFFFVSSPCPYFLHTGEPHKSGFGFFFVALCIGSGSTSAYCSPSTYINRNNAAASHTYFQTTVFYFCVHLFPLNLSILRIGNCHGYSICDVICFESGARQCLHARNNLAFIFTFRTHCGFDIHRSKLIRRHLL